MTEEPKPDELVLYPDYVIGRMLRAGPSVVEADLSMAREGVVEFVLRRRESDSAEIIGRVPTTHFRMAMARFAVVSRLPNLYLGQVFFSCDFEREGRVCSHGFSLFHCNEPTMAIWLRLYLYAIDGIWPLRRDAA